MISEIDSLQELLASVNTVVPGLVSSTGQADVSVTAITQDSRAVVPGTLFCAVAGATLDGHDFVDSAIDAGAVAVVVERATTDRVPEVLTTDTRRATGYLAAAQSAQPSKHLDLVGVTGTNGKTSVVSLVAHIVRSCGDVAAAMGTLTGALTTAAAPEFQRSLRQHLVDGCSVVAAEISSHALDQQRIAGSDVSVAIFTNLSQDHLDYHADMEEYFEAKAQLFTDEFGADAVIDISDPWGARLAERIRELRSTGALPADHELVTVDGAALIADARLEQRSSAFTWRGHAIELPLGGSFSVTNAALAAEAAVILGYDEAAIAAALHVAVPIPGRFESVDNGQPFAVVVDYSHTPASVTVAIESAREISDGRVIIVFGAAGDRDPGKRPLMGAAATAADIVYVTSDNPRTEDPDAIIDDVVVGIENSSHRPAEIHRIADRAEAIRSAITGAVPGDIVVIAGKGHEDYQIVGTTRSDFDDREHARSALLSLGWESAS